MSDRFPGNRFHPPASSACGCPVNHNRLFSFGQPDDRLASGYQPSLPDKAFLSVLKLLDQQAVQRLHPFLCRLAADEIMQLIRVLRNPEILLFSGLGIPDVFFVPGNDPVAGRFAKRMLSMQVFPHFRGPAFLQRRIPKADSLHAVGDLYACRLQHRGHHIPKLHHIRLHTAGFFRPEAAA